MAVNKSAIVGIVLEVALLTTLWVWLGGFSTATLVWSAGGGLLGFFAGWLVLKQSLTLKPIARSVPPAAAHQPEPR